MKAVCLVFNVSGFGPERMIEVAEGKAVKYTELAGRPKRTCGISRMVYTRKDHPYDVTICDNLRALGDINVSSSDSLVVVGGRDSVLDMLRNGGLERTIKVRMPNVTVGVFRQKNRLAADVIAVKIDSRSHVSSESSGAMGKDRFVKGNVVHTFEHKSLGIKEKRFQWRTFDVTKELGLSRSGDFTVHPLAFHDPLKCIFDNNKW